jgi:N-acetylneuraminic acid mutarotase
LRTGLNTVGRNPTNDFCLREASVSSFHAEMTVLCMTLSTFRLNRAVQAAVAAGLMVAGSGAATANPFTYQGRLVDGGALAGGSYELTFRLFDQLAGGAQVGSTLVLAPVAVTNGLFTVNLDFGNSSFSGADRWLEMSARTNGSVAAPETLAPRHPITAVPYAIRALSGSGNAAELTTGTVPDARLSANIARISDLLSLSNSLAARLTALEGQLSGLPPAGVAAVSASPTDATLVGEGWVNFSSVPAPAWVNGSSVDAPTPRSGHSAVWTGQQWLIWGGTVGGGILSAVGAAYDPAADAWAPISQLNPPAARQGHSAVWTGTELIVWGGIGASGPLGTGGSYHPVTANWSTVSTTGAPAARQQHVAVWTGARMVVWGGRDAGGLLADGARFDPASSVWNSLPTASAPEARSGAAGVWTGTHLIVWGGQGALGELNSGALLPLSGGVTPGTWGAVNPSGAPGPRQGHTLVWTGSRLLVWGGKQGGTALNTGGIYDPATDSWAPLPTTGAPAARHAHVAVWTGEEMVVFGGQTGPSASSAVATGGAYNPTTGTWRPLTGAGNPVARSGASAAWTGTEFLVFGGASGAGPLAALQRLNPQPTWYFYRKP